MSESAKAVGAPGEIKFRGKTKKLGPVTIEMLGMFDAWVERLAFEAVERSRGFIPDVQYRERLEAVIRLVAMGALQFGSVACMEAARSLAGQKYQVLLQLKAGNPSDPEIDEKYVEDLFQESQEKLLAEMQRMTVEDPTKPAPAMPAAGNISQ